LYIYIKNQLKNKFKMNKILISSLASIALLSHVANAQTKVGNAGVITGTVGVASQYLSKGLDSNRDKPSASLTGEFASDTNVQLILGAGLFYSTPDKPGVNGGGYSYELDYNIGLRKTFDKVTFDIGYSLFTFPQAMAKVNYDTGQYYAKAVFAATKDTSLSIYYEQDDTGGQRPGSTANPTGLTSDHYYELGLSHNFGPASLNVSYGNFEDNISFYKLGSSKEFMGLNFTADYIKQDRSRQTWNAATKDEEFFVVGASKSF
jgi:uncharacterized protein (TIGR02001 family)